jgi:hypothetical protein
MASNVYTSGVEKITNGTLTYLSSTWKMMLLGIATVYTPNVDHDFVDMAGANDPIDSEISTTNYVGGFAGGGRKTLASKTITTVDGSDRVEYSSAGFTWTNLGPSTGGPTPAYGLIINELTNDAASQLLALCDFTDTQVNSGDFTVNPGTGGWFYITTV